MSSVQPTSAGPREGGHLPDDLDGLLRTFFRAEMPEPWPVLKPPAPAVGSSTPRRRLFARSRLALPVVGRIAQSGDTVELGVHENQVVFAADDAWLTTRRIDGQFPNYKQLLPESFEHEVTLSRNELLDVVRRVGVLVQRTSPIQLRFAEGELRVLARTQGRE